MIHISPESQFQRLDNFLLKRFKDIPKALIYKLIRSGQVRVNSKRIEPSYKLYAGDIVRTPPFLKQTEKKTLNLSDESKSNFEKSILFEDKYFLCINKPSGQAVHGGSGMSFGTIEQARHFFGNHLELVHRLDRDTSGCLVISKRRVALRKLQDDWKNRKVHKAYSLVVNGIWSNKLKKVDLPLKKELLASGQHLVRVNPSGKQSITKFTIVKQQSDKTFLTAKLITGRTHQIRIHTSYYNCPIIGDKNYSKIMNKIEYILDKNGINRLFLHASRLDFTHPMTDEPISVEAPLPIEWDKVKYINFDSK